MAAPDSAPAGSRRGALAGWLRAPLHAVQFLTILPAPVRLAAPADELGRAETFFPMVGLLLGLGLVLLDTLLAPLVAPLVRDILLVAMLALLTGGLHLDGLADTADGLFGARDRDRRLAIMHDPRTGSFGVVALILVLLAKVAALGALSPAGRVGALLLAPCLGRWAIVLATRAFPYARPKGTGRAFKDSLCAVNVVGAAATAILVAALAGHTAGLVAWAGASLLVLAVGRAVSTRLGGLTGDVYGALCEIVETGTLIALGAYLGGMPT